ncbi:MAG TPA: glucose 1-dehydrogenase [Stellaceae bacterium]|nr:glucose 1-dehydrogenase [Stellaceae bacterium]
MKPQGKITIVTGGASGIGAAIAERFAAEGAEAIAADLACPDDGLTGGGKPRLHRHKLDVSDGASVARLVEAVLARFERVDVLVNCAGIGANKPFLDTPVELFDRILAVNLRGTFLMSQAVARRMPPEGGSIINIGSISGLRGNLGRAAYGASKGGLVTLSEVMAVELASRKIRVNVIAPGPIETPLVESMLSPAERAIWTRRLPLGRYGTAAEVAAAAVFLASDEASYVTGHVLAVDGGFLASGVIEAPPKE